MLRDLNELALKVRDDGSRQSIVEAIKCYEAGAYRAAIVTTWTAVAFDLTHKFLELATEGEAEAKAFQGTFSTAQSNQNTEQLLKIEREILETARDKFQFINLAEYTFLSRLKEDRHKCAHPALVADNELFTPSNELARAHITAALDGVLVKSPVYGRVILEKYGKAIKEGLLPNSREDCLSYIKTNFLDKIRDNFLRNFAIVIAKALVKDVPPEWLGAKRSNLTRSLEAISLFEKDQWNERIRHDIIKLEEAVDEAGRRAFIGLSALIPSLRIGTNQAKVDRAKVAIQSFKAAEQRWDVFLGVRIPVYATEVLALYAKQTMENQAKILAAHVDEQFWPNSLEILGRATSFRNAEYLYDAFIAPFNTEISQSQFTSLCDTIIDNGQIWAATEIPSKLIATLSHLQSVSGLAIGKLVEFRDQLQGHGLPPKYADFFSQLKEMGVDLHYDQDCKYEDAVPF